MAPKIAIVYVGFFPGPVSLHTLIGGVVVE
jgi:hypothetical protein